ncbi:tetratricopeptide repeat protein [Aliikangiella marina]|uniref:Tetratricopeptide repeat protein n=1 Tax=Aliikangiella marina TaxID=1712262 RepID=A0A545TGX6_9GAMM|nr:tetratricopeptide repeat protein [Aliikangiella marina]TQV76448.1 tetratricopeptide repeat protein [Aliikangiella marina]
MSEHEADLGLGQTLERNIESRIEALIDISRYEDAEKLSREALASEPEDAYLLFLLARAQFGQSAYDQCEATLHACLAADPEFSWAYYLLSLLHHIEKRFNSEIQCAEKAASMAPQEPTFIQRLAEAYLTSGEVKQAKAVLQQLLEIEPDSKAAHQLMGDIDFRLTNYAAAETHYRQALTFDPENIELLNDLARSLYGQKGKHQEALDMWFNMVQLDPTNPVLTDNLISSIKDWQGEKSASGKGKNQLSDLPQALQYFYEDHQKRQSFMQKWGYIVWPVIWIVVLAGVSFLFSLAEK